jgi:predicted amidohydrolase
VQAALVAIQLEIDADVLASPDAYKVHLEAEGERALAEGGGDQADARLVVYPEVAGHLALYALAPPAARRAKTLGAALASSAVRRPLDVLRGVATSRLLAPRNAVLAALAPDGERWWKSVFGPLARRLDAYIVAGSHLRLGTDGEMTNASLLFAPDGKLVATTDKVNLVPGLEDAGPGALGLARGKPNVPIVETSIGRVATLVGYDAGREPRTKTERFVALGPQLAERRGVDVVANPAASLSRKEPASMGLCGSLEQAAFARYGVTAHLVGKVLDLAYEGASEIAACEGNTVRVLARAQHHDRGGHVTALVGC